VLWIATVANAFYTNNFILLPTVVLLGSFLVPVTGVVWYLDHDPSPALSPRRIVSAFILSGILGALAASTLDFSDALFVIISIPSFVFRCVGQSHAIRTTATPQGHPSHRNRQDWHQPPGVDLARDHGGSHDQGEQHHRGNSPVVSDDERVEEPPYPR
jgi:hypothetical protein